MPAGLDNMPDRLMCAQGRMSAVPRDVSKRMGMRALLRAKISLAVAQ
jgi:hypothetical protein